MASTEKKSWEQRLGGCPDSTMVEFVESLSVDKRLYKYDIAGSVAHAKMLAGQGIISQGDFRNIRKGLLDIAQRISQDKFEFDKRLEDIHMAVESALAAAAGPAGAKLHTGRSRNDQVATDMRLWVRDQIEILQSRINNLQKAFVKLASTHAADLMPGYTHLQRAQPVSVASYLLSFVEQLERDFVRLGNCRQLANICPLGSGAVAGSTLALDRNFTAGQLGFTAVSRNSIDAVGDRDFCAEFIFDCAVIAAHLSRLAEDWIVFSSQEFGFVRIADAFCTSSSMMPQKRNPDALELIRGASGTVYGALTAILTVLKAQPSGYNRDLQEDKRHVFAAFDTVSACLEMAGKIVAHSRFDKTRTAEALDAGFTDATSLAEYLVTKQVPFRKAHGIVGRLVRHCEKNGKSLRQLELKEFKRYCKVVDIDVYDAIGPEKAALRYATEGACGPRQAKQQIAYWNKYLAKR